MPLRALPIENRIWTDVETGSKSHTVKLWIRGTLAALCQAPPGAGGQGSHYQDLQSASPYQQIFRH